MFVGVIVCVCVCVCNVCVCASTSFLTLSCRDGETGDWDLGKVQTRDFGLS